MTPAPVAALSAAVVRPSGGAPLGPIDLAVATGEIVALVGASGAGKSTALRLLAGLQAPHAGTATAPATGRTGFVFQSPTLMPWADAVANVALPLELTGAPDARARAAAALSDVGLGDRTGARPGQLSGGMAMRVSLARALVTQPDLLLLDEPFAALDSVTRRRLIEDLHRLWAARRDGGRPLAVVFVTHDVEEAVYLTERAVVLAAADGRPVAEVACPGPLPRPAGWRADAAFRRAVEDLAGALEGSMETPLPLEGEGVGGWGGGTAPARTHGDADRPSSAVNAPDSVDRGSTPTQPSPLQGEGSNEGRP